MLPDGAREKLLAGVNSARDRLVVTWLADGGLRIGELCGLHLADLHLRDGAACGQCRTPHVHVCHRPGNPNGAEAKTKLPWRMEEATVTGGLIKRVSPAMVHAYFDYMTSEYPRGQSSDGMLLVQLHGPSAGRPLALFRSVARWISGFLAGAASLISEARFLLSVLESPPTGVSGAQLS